MPVYPTYYPQMNNGYNQQMQSPYQQRMDFLQSYQQSLQPAQMSVANQQMQMPVSLNGKIVPSVEVITANDVPMDGSVAVFPKQDMSEIYVKFWENNGTIRTIVFKPILEQNPTNLSQTAEKLKFDLSDEATTAFMQRFDSLEKQINDLITKSMTESMTSKTKKENVENE